MGELEDWETLLTHPGYLRLLAYARKEWKDDLPAKFKAAVMNNQNASEAVMRVDAESNAINALLSVPQMRITQLTQQQTMAADPSRRGGL